MVLLRTCSKVPQIASEPDGSLPGKESGWIQNREKGSSSNADVLIICSYPAEIKLQWVNLISKNNQQILLTPICPPFLFSPLKSPSSSSPLTLYHVYKGCLTVFPFLIEASWCLHWVKYLTQHVFFGCITPSKEHFPDVLSIIWLKVSLDIRPESVHI